MSELERNDVLGATLLYRKGLETKSWTPEQGEFIMMLQDDPAALITSLEAVDAEMPGALEKCLQKAASGTNTR